MATSLRYRRHSVPIKIVIALFMIHWNAVGEFFRPIGIPTYSVSIWCCECSFFDIGSAHGDLIESTCEIHCSEELCFVELIEDVVDTGNEVLFCDHCSIEITAVDDHAVFSLSRCIRLRGINNW